MLRYVVFHWFFVRNLLSRAQTEGVSICLYDNITIGPHFFFRSSDINLKCLFLFTAESGACCGNATQRTLFDRFYRWTRC